MKITMKLVSSLRPMDKGQQEAKKTGKFHDYDLREHPSLGKFRKRPNKSSPGTPFPSYSTCVPGDPKSPVPTRFFRGGLPA